MDILTYINSCLAHAVFDDKSFFYATVFPTTLYKNKYPE
jgi:hypothetical protein